MDNGCTSGCSRKREDNGCTSRGLFFLAKVLQGFPTPPHELYRLPYQPLTSTDIIGQRNTRKLAVDFLVEPKSSCFSLSLFFSLLSFSLVLRPSLLCSPRLPFDYPLKLAVKMIRSRVPRRFLKNILNIVSPRS